MSPRPTLEIIIVNWNSGHLLKDCLRSIGTEDTDKVRIVSVVVVDNASGDDSLRALESTDAAIPLSLQRNSVNEGFARACNQVGLRSDAQYLLFLNPDAQLGNHSLAMAIDLMEKNERVGICGAALINDAGQISRSCARFPRAGNFLSMIVGLDRVAPHRFPGLFMTEWDHRESRVVDHVMGAFFLVRREVFQELAGFDERFFLYLEDLDFSYRAWKLGWQSFYLASCRVYHKGGGSSGRIPATALFYVLRSRLQYSYKHLGWLSATTVLLATLFVEPFSRLALAAGRRSLRDAGRTTVAMARLWGSLVREGLRRAA
ncbi:MAG: glycosyltransferase family 2 protein [Chloroflexi bacterium]|nr:MAG: glycosyltransferase family 2 protein [Chloroflexota bacterium]